MTLKYRLAGTGKNVVLVHGFGEDSSVWTNQVDYLKNDFRLCMVDLPAREDDSKWSLPFFADELKSMLDREGIDSCSMIGHSMGGYITLAFADKYPEILRSFGLFHSSAFPDNAEKIETRRKGIAFIREHGPAPFLETMIPNLFSAHSRETMAEVVNKAKDVKNNFSVEALVRYYEAMIERPDRTEVLRSSKVPVLFVMGKYDTAVRVEDSLKQCHLPENAYIHILRKSGHMGMLEEKELSNRALDKFLRDN